jgi:transcriptional regulator with XRE-family HTH domain
MTHNTVSSVTRHTTMVVMSNAIRTLGNYVKERREALPLSLTDFAKRSGLSKSELSALENGKIGLPGADKRRKLAAALGVSHLDILVAAGEISEDEVHAAGVPKIPELDARRQRIIDLFLELPVHERYLTSLESTLTTFLAFDPNTGQKIDDVPEHRNGVRVSGAK